MVPIFNSDKSDVIISGSFSSQFVHYTNAKRTKDVYIMWSGIAHSWAAMFQEPLAISSSVCIYVCFVSDVVHFVMNIERKHYWI